LAVQNRKCGIRHGNSEIKKEKEIKKSREECLTWFHRGAKYTPDPRIVSLSLPSRSHARNMAPITGFWSVAQPAEVAIFDCKGNNTYFPKKILVLL
jgi:hypothetical protein